MSWLKVAGLLFNGCIAFGLNIVSFTANKKAGALSMTVAGEFRPFHPSPFTYLEIANIKQVLTILFAVLLFDLSITWMNGLGIVFTLIGGAWYGVVDYEEKQRKREREYNLVT